MAAIKYNVTSGDLPITVNLLDEGMTIIDTNVHSIYEEGEFSNIPSGTYTIQMIEDNGCVETYSVCEGGCGFGLLYNGWVLEDARGIAADGWHVISNYEALLIRTNIGGSSEGYKLAQSGTDYWGVDFGTNTTGLSLRGSGKRAYNTGAYSDIYNTFYGWSEDDFNANYRYIYYLSTDGIFYIGDVLHKKSALGIRLAKDDATLENYTGNDGKVYEAVKIGGIVVTAQNIAETKYANGDLIPSYGIHGDTYTSAEWIALTEGALCPYNNDWQLACLSNAAIDYCKFGVLYNWSAASDIRGIAPTGYHIPTYAEWDTLITWLEANGYGYGGSGEDVAKAMCYTLGWNNNNVAGSPGREQWLNNSTGFSALASGQRYYSGGFCPQGTIFHIWTSTINYTVGFINNSADNFTFINTGGDDKSGLAIRCLRDNLVGYIEGETVADYDGNIYTTVQLGTQVWLVENLKVGHYNNGDLIPIVDDDTEWSTLVTGACCAYNYDWARYTCVPIPTTTTTTTIPFTTTTTTTTTCNPLKCDYGLLYNWYAVDTGKLAPTGWHVPTDAEWTTLTTYLGGESIAGGKMKEIGTTHWESPNTGADNSSGFSGLPGGYRHFIGFFTDVAGFGYWWASTEYPSTYAWLRCLFYGEAIVERLFYPKDYALSVRCVRDYYEGHPSTIQDYDGNTYDVIEIGTQLWTVQNLKVTHYNDGETIPNITDASAWEALTTGGLCAYDNDWETYACVDEPTTTTTTTTTIP